MRSLEGTRGSALIEITLGALLVAGIFFFTYTASSRSVRLTHASARQNLALGFATELIEYFRTKRGVGTAPAAQFLQAYLSVNPISGLTTAADLYKTCAHINILDRTSNTVVNPDPIANLPPSLLDAENSAANRYYKIEIVDPFSLAVDTTKCGFAANEAAAVPSANQRYYVTVAVAWLPVAISGAVSTEIAKVALQTLIPD